MSDDQDDWWTATDRATEAERIRALAEGYRGKLGSGQRAFPGLARRSSMDWLEIGRRLADLQARYAQCDEAWPKAITFRALLLLWPAMLAAGGHTQVPKSREARRKMHSGAGELFLALFMMAANSAPSSPSFDVPIIKIMKRNKEQRYDSTKQRDQRQGQECKDEIIGRAVLQEYCSNHPPRIDSDFETVSKVVEIDGVSVPSKGTVERYYQRYRVLAFGRGYADSRALWAEIEGRPWPNDQIWLSDFPEISG